jgi:two-component system sensor histidine kinase YesM
MGEREMPRKRRERKQLSIRWRIFLFMLAVSVIPITIFTIYALFSTYSKSYDQSILNNRNSMSWEVDRLSLFSDELKKSFYSMEFEKSFKKAIINPWTEDNNSSKMATISDTLVTQLNNYSDLASIELYIANGDVNVIAKRSGISSIQSVDILGPFTRLEGMQTNMFLKRKEDKLYAVHYVNTFPERKLVAKIAVNLKEKSFREILNILKIYETETVYCFNDQYEVLMTEGAPVSEDILDTIVRRIRDNDYKNEYFEAGNNIVIAGESDRGIFHVVKIIPKREILSIVLPTAYAGIFIGFLCVIAATFLSAMLSYYVSKPIIALTNKVKNISTETLEIEKEQYASDEIGILEEHIASFVTQIKELIQEEYKTKLEAKSAQIRALQAQINPHFLHNTLQLMGSVSLSNDAKRVYRIASSLSDMMRYCMDYETDFVTIAEELKHLDNYLFIQKERYYDRFTINYEVDDIAKSCLIPKLLLQPIIENSFEHGFKRSTSDWKLWIHVFLTEDGKVRIVVKDNGNGIDPAELQILNSELKKGYASMKSKKHIGLINVNSRIKLHFSDEDGITIKSEIDRGTEVCLVFDSKRIEGGDTIGI